MRRLCRTSYESIRDSIFLANLSGEGLNRMGVAVPVFIRVVAGSSFRFVPPTDLPPVYMTVRATRYSRSSFFAMSDRNGRHASKNDGPQPAIAKEPCTDSRPLSGSPRSSRAPSGAGISEISCPRQSPGWRTLPDRVSHRSLTASFPINAKRPRSRRILISSTDVKSCAAASW